ncbi:T9SS type A sorting domain-containing protein [Crocinitomix algicola]|uniref:T9SS type A sorting domain-containing protein n=1 Tax=Crocinitomix algicola TaxID=1740263 RepID=UPI00082C0F4D|nr:T9SS type A sorting domain-containing protein [Crocinitomix algicola]
MIKIYDLKLKIALFCLPIWGISFGQIEAFEYTGALQTYSVPLDVSSIRITAIGAAGGEGGLGEGGHGAQISGTFSVTPGEELTILVGGVGQSASYVGGGGGGTFVWNADDELLIAAGGGGGAGHTDAGEVFYDGIDASVDESGTVGNGIPDGAGAEGLGGTPPSVENYAGGGAGWLSDGNDGTEHFCESSCTGGIRPLDGGAGGTGGGSGVNIAAGGYGGGGGGNARCGAVGGGGGGGYSGGGAGGELILGRYDGGGGGGSYNGGIDQENLAGIGIENGQVTIEVMCTALEIVEDYEDVCLGDEITLDGSSITGGTVLWSDGIENGVPFTLDEIGEFTFIATSTSDTDCGFVVELEVHDLPEIIANAEPETVCSGQELTLFGSGGASYTWTPGDIEDDEPFYPAIGEHTYTVTGEDWYGCINTDEITVTVVESPTIVATASSEEVCLGESVTFEGSGGLIYEWDPAIEDGETVLMDEVGTFIYHLTGWDELGGCANEDEVAITVYDVPSIDSYTTEDEVLGGDGSIDITVSGGAPDYSFDWDNDGVGDFDDSEDLIEVEGGVYTVVVQDLNGCQTSIEATVNSQVGIDHASLPRLNVYPNPVFDYLNIEWVGVFDYEITSVTGKIVAKGQVKDLVKINFAQESKGVYFIMLNNKATSTTIKLIHQ